MPAKSKSQQRFFGMVHAAQKGGKGTKNPAVASAAKKMSPDSVGHFAKTKHKGLPDKKAAAKFAADAATVLAVEEPAFSKVAADVLRSHDLHWAIFNAFPTRTKQARERIFSVIVKAASALQKRANGMGMGGAAPMPAGADAGGAGGDMMGMGAALGGMGAAPGGMASAGSGMGSPPAQNVPTTSPMSFNGSPTQGFAGF